MNRELMQQALDALTLAMSEPSDNLHTLGRVVDELRSALAAPVAPTGETQDAQWQAVIDAAVMQERERLLAPLLDGWTVLQHLDETAVERTTHINVSDTLDAAVRAIRASSL